MNPRIRDALKRALQIGTEAGQGRTVDAEAVGEAFPVGGADELDALGEDPEPLLDLRRALVALAIPASYRAPPPAAKIVRPSGRTETGGRTEGGVWTAGRWIR